jgi:UDP-N-acetyl-D-glucosamine dehydrogenase
MNSEILRNIDEKKLKVGIIGLGYVGLPLMLRFVDVGFKVVGFDIDLDKIDKLNKGFSYISHIPKELISNALEKGMEATSHFARIAEIDAIIICVPTPLSKYREPDLSYVTDTVDSILKYIRRGQIISLESTTYPGTTDEELLPRISRTGLSVGTDIFLVYSPEREDPGNVNFNTSTIPKVVGGHSVACLALGVALYSSVINKVVPVSSTKAAEMTKLLENIHRAVNIGLVNEMKIVADRMGIDIYEVIKAASTKPFGFTPYYPGPGLGGHCIPIDPFYLTWKAREYGINTRFIELAGEVNTNMPRWVLSKIIDAMNERGMSIKNSSVLILGVAYKKNVDDSRESPAIKLMELLFQKGAKIEYSDPFIPVFPKKLEHNFDLTSIEINEENLSKFDMVLLATDHDLFDYDLILSKSKLVVDTRGKFDRANLNVVAA